VSDHSTIEWTDATWNPVRGCTKVSPGCKHCYAETFAERFRGVPGHPFEQGFDLRLVPEKLNEPLRWRSARKIFVNSMSDLFQEEIPIGYIARVGRVMEQADWHTYQVLTKRDDRLHALLSGDLRWMASLRHVWFGVSVEDREYGLPRIERLRATPVQVRFLSIEPLLEDVGKLDLGGIHWVIVGGESGPGARPMKQAWVTSILKQCERQQVPFFFKQWGGVRKKETGRALSGREWNDMPGCSVVERSALSGVS
jgi:protein gp37